MKFQVEIDARLQTIELRGRSGAPATRGVRGGVGSGAPATRGVRGGVGSGAPATRGVRGGVLSHGDEEVRLDGRPLFVDAARIGPDTWSLIIRKDGEAPRSVEATVVSQSPNGVVDVYVGAARIPVNFRSGNGRRGRGADATGGSDGPQRVVAPMPGKVVRLLVKPGDEVTVRQGLVVVEAMKMENELRSSRNGRVRDVLVDEGQSVEAGSTLVLVE